MYSFSYLEPVCCSMSSSNCCFLTCIQVSQEAGQVLLLNVKVKVAQCPTLCNPMDYTVHGIPQVRILEWVEGSLLQGTFPTQGSNLCLLHCRRSLCKLSHMWSPRILEWVACPSSSRSSWPRNRTRVSCIAGRFFTKWAVRKAFIVE